MPPILFIPLAIALGVLLFAGLAEWLHTRRIRVMARLAFGPAGAAYAWTRAVPFLRAFALAAFAWGLATLWVMNREAADSLGAKGPDKTATRLIFVGDISPSMYLVDAGPDGKETRYARMGEVVDGILQRVSGNLRFGVVGFYTDALPVVMEARDPELVRNVFNGLPLSYGMPVGQTDLGSALNIALARVADFPPGTVRLIVLTDGDTTPMLQLSPRPPSVKELLILGLGNPHKGSFIDGHQSRQEGETLQRIASQLGGTYDDVNTNQLATTALGDLVVTAPPPKKGLDLSEWAILCMVLGASVLALLPVALAWRGSDWEVLRIPARERREARAQRGEIEPEELAAR